MMFSPMSQLSHTEKKKRKRGIIEKGENSGHQLNGADNNMLFLMYADMDDRNRGWVRIEGFGGSFELEILGP